MRLFFFFFFNVFIIIDVLLVFSIDSEERNQYTGGKTYLTNQSIVGELMLSRPLLYS